jgi:hypothetical protein
MIPPSNVTNDDAQRQDPSKQSVGDEMTTRMKERKTVIIFNIIL